MSVTVERIALREIHLRLREPFRISSGETWNRRILLVEVFGSDDRGGSALARGECVAGERPAYSPETVETARMAIEQWLAARLLGQTFEHAREVWPLLDRNLRGHRMAKAALEMACWELQARLEGWPLSGLLGGVQGRVPTGISLGIQSSPEELLAKARQALERGYRKVKVKIEPGGDLDFLRPLRDALGDDAPLAVDANAAYSLRDMERLLEIDALALMMIEQPLEREDLVRHARLQERLETPLCLDESITSVARAEDMRDLDAGRIVNIKPGRVGGFAQAIAIHDVCRAAEIPVWCGGMLESGIGRAHNVALASLPGFVLPGDLSPSDRYWAQDIVTPEWTMDDDGMVRVPRDQPGCGVEVDEERLEEITAWRVVLDPGESEWRSEAN